MSYDQLKALFDETEEMYREEIRWYREETERIREKIREERERFQEEERKYREYRERVQEEERKNDEERERFQEELRKYEEETARTITVSWVDDPEVRRREQMHNAKQYRKTLAKQGLQVIGNPNGLHRITPVRRSARVAARVAAAKIAQDAGLRRSARIAARR